ncbi:MAG: hypothetical protein AB9835_10490 [Eubacteriales bacterium]
MKGLALLLSAAGIVLVLSGCGGEKVPNSTTDIVPTGIFLSETQFYTEAPDISQISPEASQPAEEATYTPATQSGTTSEDTLSDADIDELLRTLTEMEAMLESLDGVADEDLIIP